MSLLISKHIIASIQNDKKLTEIVEDRIYPVVIPIGTPQYPFITFTSSAENPDETKDGVCMDNVSTVMLIVSKSYNEAISIGSLVRRAIEGKTAKYEDYDIIESNMMSWTEDYAMDIDSFTVTVSFNFKTYNY